MRKAVTGVFIALLWAAGPAWNQDLELHFLDVGQGDGTLIICPNGNRILVDLGSKGGKSTAQKAAIGQHVRNNLRMHAGQRVLDFLVVTHPDGDHFNLLRNALAGVTIDAAIYGGDFQTFKPSFRNFLSAFQTSGRLPTGHHDPENQPTNRLDCGSAKIWILAANVVEPTSQSNFVNNTPSVVLRIAFNGDTAILTGDATFTTEDAILQKYTPAFLDTDILKLGHHGSRATSTSRTWANTVSPEIAFASASGTKFGHPARDIFDRVVRHTDDLSAEHEVLWCAKPGCCTTTSTDEAIYVTPSAGLIVATSDGSGWKLTCSKSAGC